MRSQKGRIRSNEVALHPLGKIGFIVFFEQVVLGFFKKLLAIVGTASVLVAGSWGCWGLTMVISPKAEEIVAELSIYLALTLMKAEKIGESGKREEFVKLIEELIDDTFAESFAGGANVAREIERNGKT